MDTLQVAGMISKELKRSGVVDKAPQLASNIAMSFSSAGLKLCDLKPLAELLGCEPEMGEIERKAHQNVVLVEALRKKIDDIRELIGCAKGEYLLGRIDDLVNRPMPPSASWYCTQVAQALNWERTEFDTLDELLEEIREADQAHSKFVDGAIEQNERLEACLEALEYYADTGIYSNGDVPGHVYVLDDNGSTAQVCLMQHGGRNGGHIPASEPLRVVDAQSGFEAGGYVKDGSVPGVAGVVRGSEHAPLVMAQITKALRLDTHTLLHAGELYREVTVLLHTEQLVAWRTADGQEYSAPAHQALLDPDEDGLAAELLSRITGYEVCSEHMAELRAQMTGGVK